MIASERCRPAFALAGRVAMAAGAAQLAAGAAWAAEGEAVAGDPWMNLLWKTVNFVVLAGIIWYFGRKPIGALFRNAAEAARATLEGQRERTAKYERQLAEQREKIEGLQAELERLAEGARQEARAEHERQLAEARAQAERIRTTVRLQVEQEFSKARKELQSELAAQTVRLAEQRLRDQMDEDAQRRIASRAIDELGANG